MASSNRRKKQNRAKAAAKHAEARRRRAATARIRAVQVRLSRIYHPETSAAELAILLGEHYQGVPVAGWLASALLREGSSLARLQDAAKLMLSSQDAPSLTALTFAAAVAGAAGDAGEERCLIDQALAAVEADDPDVRLEVVDFISTSGHAAEAVELLELRLKEAPDEDFAADLHGAAIERAYATACADETAARERAAVHRFADRTGLVAFKDAVSAFLDGTELGEAVRARVTEELSVTDDVDWSPEGPGGVWQAGRGNLLAHRGPRAGRGRDASEKRTDPAQDFAWPAVQRAAQGGAAAAAEGWEKFWLDEQIPALLGRTPRQAARGRERPYLEAMLRQFEYEADLLAADGTTGIDTAWQRGQLDMPSDIAD